MGITTRWTPATPEYMETICYISERQYHQALDNLQRLVTQRLFELHRLNLSGVGKCFPFQVLSMLTLIQGTKLTLTSLNPCKLDARQFTLPLKLTIMLHRLLILLVRH